MDLRTLHLVSTYALLCLDTTGLWMGESERTPPYPLVVCLCAVVAYLVTDRRPLIELPTRLSNVLGIAILLTTAYEFMQDVSGTVLALAHFMVYLQVVKFFRSRRRRFGQLYVLNLLQMAIACVINRNLEFSVLVIHLLGRGP